MIVFLALTGLVLVIISHLFFIKPGFVAAAGCKKEMAKIGTEIAAEEKDAFRLKNLRAEQKKLEQHISGLEGDLFHGLNNSRLIPFFTFVAAEYDFPVEPSYKYERSDEVPMEDYLEVYSNIKILSYDYLKMGRFINALESSNPGVRISKITLGRSDPEKTNGLVNADFELRLLGFREPDEQNENWTPCPNVVFDADGGRNLFDPFAVKVIVDPERRFKEALQGIKITGKLKGYGLIIKKRTGKSTDWILGESIVLGGKEVSLQYFSIDLPQDYVIIRRKDTNTSYRLTTKRGQVTSVVSEKSKN